jgi:SAM-dependent methyltransferase
VGTAALARAFPWAQVVAVDTSPPLLVRAGTRAERLGLGDRVHVREGDLGAGGLAVDARSDLVWAAMVVHHIGDQQGALATLRSLLRPGGRVAVVEGDRTLRYLPADLAARLEPALHDAARTRFEAMRATLPDAVEHSADWPELLTAAGFTDVTSRTFPVELAAPLSPAARSLVRQNLAGLRAVAAEQLQAGDLDVLDQLLDDDDPAGLARRDDLTLRASRTVYTGVA